MKKILFILFAALAFVACDKDFQSQTEKTDLETIVQNNKVSLKQALLYAENSINGINPTTRSAERKVKSTEIYVAKPATRSAEGTEVSFYLINYEDNEGFAMVSTDSRATPVYAYSDSGNLTPEDFETNPGLQIFRNGAIQHYENEIANSGTYGLGDDRLPIVEIPEELMAVNDKVNIVEVNRIYYFEGIKKNENTNSAFVPVEWHQHLPYGQHFDNQKAGCGPVAAAQVMAYYQHPTNHNNRIYDWEQMLSLPSPINDPSQIETVRNISNLLFDIGERAIVDDSGYETTVYTSNLVNAIRDFGYSCQYIGSFDSDIVKGNIIANKPIIVGADNIELESGHLWIIDGYKLINYTTTLYNITYPYNVYSSTSSDPSTYYHCNWGWSSIWDSNLETYLNNGYYLYNSFTYKDNMEIIYNIHPQVN